MSKRTVYKTTEHIDIHTGELVRSGYTIMVDKVKGDVDFVKVFKCFTVRVLEDLEIENGKAKLLFWFIDQIQDMKVNQTQTIHASADMISNDLGCAVVSVRLWLSFLIKKEYIKRQLKPNGKVLCNSYIVNPEYIIKGKLIIDKEEQK